MADYHAVPVFLDENDELRAAVPKTPTDNQFRRGLYVMLIVLGLLAATSLIYARDSRTDVLTAQRQSTVLLEQLRKNDEDARQRAVAATQERADQARKLDALQGFVAALLANSTDPAIRKAVQQAVKDGTLDSSVLSGSPSTTTTPSASATPRASGGATPTSAPATPRGSGGATPAPSPAPTPAPAPTATPILPLPSLPCIPVLGLTCP